LGPGNDIAIAAPDHSTAPDEALLALLFAAGKRPSLADVRARAEAGGEFAISHVPPEGVGWVEALVTGLTFEIHGLAPGEAEPARPVAHRYGLPSGWWEPKLEAVTVRPGPHLAAGAAMLPVVRGCVALGAALAALPGVEAAVWLPARVAMGVGYFRDVADAWRGGGPFPALGLAALGDASDGGLQTHGLGFFIGRELHVAPWPAAVGAELAKLAVRAVHALVESHPEPLPTQLAGPDGERLTLSGEGPVLTLRRAD
jgi:hypothetical protein